MLRTHHPKASEALIPPHRLRYPNRRVRAHSSVSVGAEELCAKRTVKSTRS